MEIVSNGSFISYISIFFWQWLKVIKSYNGTSSNFKEEKILRFRVELREIGRLYAKLPTMVDIYFQRIQSDTKHLSWEPVKSSEIG